MQGQVNRVLFQSASDAADMLGRRELSSRELTEMLLARVDAANPALNAVVELRREAALREAAAADQAIAQGVRRPLQGVPTTIKEAFNVVGLHTTWGNPAFNDYVRGSQAVMIAAIASTVGLSQRLKLAASAPRPYRSQPRACRRP